ncbi:MAG: biopolymer transporter ExbD [Verrucomicrobiae bacterium]|nr:biopolymer transporter ExbD [Verrucomicrobiae bacterium]
MRYRRVILDSDERAEINVSPLIDMVFILLIFFIVTTVFVEETGTEVDKPQAVSSTQLEKNSILIAITAKGEIVYGGKEIGLAGVRPLVARLCRTEPMPVIIQVDQKASAGTLVRDIDEAKLGNAKNVSIATQPTGAY